MKPRHFVLGAALAGAAALAAFGNRDAGSGIAEAVERPAARAALIAMPRATPPAMAPITPARRSDQAAEEPNGGEGGREQPILALAPRDTLIGADDSRFAQGPNGAGAGARDALFGHQDWTPPPPPPGPAPPAPPPTAPPLPFTFIGMALANGVWEVYLARGERTYVVRDKDVIDGMYRVDAIAPPVMTLTYLPLNQVQRLNIGVFD